MRQPHRIIVEGMDGAGKTTLVDKLAKQFDLVTITRPKGRPLGEWWAEELERPEDAPVPIHDRFFYSELVYGPVLRKSIEADPYVVDNVTWFLRHVALLIYVRPHTDVLAETITHNKQMKGVRANADRLLDAYDKVMSIEKSWYGPRFHQYDWNTQGAYEDIAYAVGIYLGR
jgi:hypothetical protein